MASSTFWGTVSFRKPTKFWQSTGPLFLAAVSHNLPQEINGSLHRRRKPLTNPISGCNKHTTQLQGVKKLPVWWCSVISGKDTAARASSWIGVTGQLHRVFLIKETLVRRGCFQAYWLGVFRSIFGAYCVRAVLSDGAAGGLSLSGFVTGPLESWRRENTDRVLPYLDWSALKTRDARRRCMNLQPLVRPRPIFSRPRIDQNERDCAQAREHAAPPRFAQEVMD